MNIILASASPRRAELLREVFDEFGIIPAGIDETVPDSIPAEETAEYTAVRKGAYIAEKYPDSLVIGCDTIVIYNGEVFGKPRDEADAKRMLRLLSGSTHYVITGVGMFLNGKSLSFSEKTAVEFYELSDKEIDEYISSGSPMDKAGAYGIQDRYFLPAKKITGDYFNVVGLPCARLRREAEKFIARVKS